MDKKLGNWRGSKFAVQSDTRILLTGIPDPVNTFINF